MRPRPGVLRVRWLTAGVEVGCRPLDVPADPLIAEAVHGALWWGAVGTVVVMALQALGVVGYDLSPLLVGAAALGGALWAMALRIRRRHSHLTLRVAPPALTLGHRVLGVPVATERIPLERVRRVEVDGDLLVVHRHDGRPLREPLPALTDGERAWLVDQVLAARALTDAFLRDALHTADHARELRAVQRRAEREGPGSG